MRKAKGTPARTTTAEAAQARIAASRLLYTEWTDAQGNAHRIRTMRLELIDKRTFRIHDTKGNTYEVPKKAAAFRRG